MKFFDIFSEPLLDVLQVMPKYSKYLKYVVKNKRKLYDIETITLMEECSLVVMIKMPKNLKDPKSFTFSI